MTAMTAPRLVRPAEPLRVLDAADVAAAAASRDLGGEIGGKARSLGALLAAGASVPAFFCVSTAVFDDVLDRVRGEVAGVLAGIDHRDRRSIQAAADAIAAQFARAQLSARDAEAIRAAFDRQIGRAHV